ncbi:MAG TPA: hypothetical protein VFQ51_18595 [Vicinamibacteria bacterium]|nr:hypothetical protein [Vicinamibacteria bacterium]
MAAVALELNDAGLLVLREGRPRPQEIPCLVLFEGDLVLTGARAAARAYRSPRSAHDAFFDRLDLEPLGDHHPPGLRHADLAYAQLASIAGDLAHDDEVFLAVPGSWSEERLALLLGIARAASLHVVGLVDAAAAAASLVFGTDACLHVDLARHRAIVSAFRGGAERQRGSVSAPEGAGSRAFEDRRVLSVAAAFVAGSRFDPLHSGPAEQALREALPGWLRELRRAETCEATLTWAGREHHATLSREDLAGVTRELQRAVAEQAKALVPTGSTRVLVSARASGIPGLTARLERDTGLDVVELPYDGAVVATLRHRDRLRHPGPSLPLVTRLPTTGGLQAVQGATG